jgi:hypothetical protein
MGKLKDVHIISNEEGSIAKFLVYMSIFLAIDISTDFIFDQIHLKECFKWGEYVLTYLIFAAVLTLIYFISRFLAYRTHIFPKTENREGIHGVSFFLLLVLSIILAIVLQ